MVHVILYALKVRGLEGILPASLPSSQDLDNSHDRSSVLGVSVRTSVRRVGGGDGDEEGGLGELVALRVDGGVVVRVVADVGDVEGLLG